MDIHQFMQQAQVRKFQWGVFDCFCFAAQAIEVMTGKNLMTLIPPYGDETSAEIMLRVTYGTTKLREVFLIETEKAHAKQIPFEESRDGDIACAQFPRRFQHPDKMDQSCGLGVIYQGSVFVCTQRGVIRVPDHMPIIDAWRF